MTTLLVIGQLAALVLVALTLFRLRWNAASSNVLIVNAMFLALYYWPTLLLHIPLDTEPAAGILIGHAGMNVGLALGHVVGAVPWRPSHVQAGPARLHLPSIRFATACLAAGLAGYTLLFVLRGIPLFAANIDVARAELIAGMGPVLWPSIVAINLAVWVAVLRDRYRVALLFGTIGGLFSLLSGWRGQLLITIMTTSVIMAHRRSLTTRAVAVFAAGMMLIGVVGAVRPVLSGQGDYADPAAAPEFSAGAVLGSGALSFVWRFTEQTGNYERTVSHFREQKLGGRGMVMDLSILLPGGGDLTLENLMREEYGLWVGGGGMPTTILGAFYADFGLAGVALLSLLAAGVQAAATAALRRRAAVNPVYYVPLGILAAAWINGMVGSWINHYVVVVATYVVGAFGLIVLYSSDAARLLGARRTPAVEPQR